ncbi:hypothetical protein [Bradyrhizobium septentrionale]|uniref:Uncharacterized protein n=1 Tax=Bradyrhizobium septentrionale TaxID=1404411 RepID=A0ABZ2NUX4_9BRAD
MGLGLASLIMGSTLSMPAFAADKISLFKVITSKDEIVIGLTDADLAQVEGQNAGGIAKMLVAKGSMSVWQYAVHKSARRSRTGAAAQDRPDRQRLAAGRALSDPAEGAADRRRQEVTAKPSSRGSPQD